MANGMLGSLPPGLRGLLAAEQMNQQRSQNQLGQIGGMLSIQGAMQNQAIQQQGLLEKQQQQQRLQQFASQLPEADRQRFLIAPMEFIKETNKTNVLSPGQSMFRGGQQVAALPERPAMHNLPVAGQPGVTQPTWLRPGEASGVAAGGMNMPEILNKDVQQAKVDVARAGRPVTNVNVRGEQKTFENENKLRDDYTTASKPFVGLRDAYNTVNAALSGPITAASTLTGATKFMKMIDPESVVRESELNMALKATGMLDRFLNLHNVVMKGQVLTPKQAEEIKTIAGTLYGAAQKQQAKTDQYFGGLANSYGLDPTRVIRDQSAVTDPNKPQRRRAGDLLEDADRIIGGG